MIVALVVRFLDTKPHQFRLRLVASPVERFEQEGVAKVGLRSVSQFLEHRKILQLVPFPFLRSQFRFQLGAFLFLDAAFDVDLSERRTRAEGASFERSDLFLQPRELRRTTLDLTLPSNPRFQTRFAFVERVVVAEPASRLLVSSDRRLCLVALLLGASAALGEFDALRAESFKRAFVLADALGSQIAIRLQVAQAAFPRRDKRRAQLPQTFQLRPVFAAEFFEALQQRV